MVKPVVKPLFSPPLDHDLLAFPPFFARLLAFLKTAAEIDCTLPNVARYQLRHTPMIYYFRYETMILYLKNAVLSIRKRKYLHAVGGIVRFLLLIFRSLP